MTNHNFNDIYVTYMKSDVEYIMLNRKHNKSFDFHTNTETALLLSSKPTCLAQQHYTELVLFVVDFDGDDMISSADLKEVINRLTGADNLLEEEMMQQLIDNVSFMLWIEFLNLKCPHRRGSLGVVSWTCDPVLALGQRFNSHSKRLLCCNPLG